MTRTEVLTIGSTKRLRNSASGNPRVLVGFTDGTAATTQRDAQVGYLIENAEFQGTPLVVTFDSKGEIVHVRLVTE